MVNVARAAIADDLHRRWQTAFRIQPEAEEGEDKTKQKKPSW
jgi:hypothetical protein